MTGASRLGGEAGVVAADARPKPHATEGVTPGTVPATFRLAMDDLLASLVRCHEHGPALVA